AYKGSVRVIALLSEYGLFLAKTITFVVAALFVIGGVSGAVASSRRKNQGGDDEGEIRVSHLNQQLDALKEDLQYAVLPESARKNLLKQKKKEDKAKRKASKKAGALEVKQKPRLYVLDFDGDMRARAVEALRREISAIMQVAEQAEEERSRLEDAGGLVTSSDIEAQQLKRTANAGLRLSVAVDTVAARGGYMMACIGDRILSAPFAVLGSIGVVAQVPNVHRLLKKHDVEVEILTAGEYKRTLTTFGENTDEGRKKFLQELDETHQLFKDFVHENRRTLDLDKVATGEHWYGTQAKELGLVDDIQTSDEYLLERCEQVDVYL